ncbi:MAG TPA: hypothetical protein VM677_31230 [Actinokineospora sp.]|nr:hypothetical protein [Actinokineospora sp.]
MRLPVRDRVSARVAVLAGLALSIGVTIVTLTESTETSRIGGLG